MPLLTAKKGTGTEGKSAASRSGLIKPKLADNAGETGTKSSGTSVAPQLPEKTGISSKSDVPEKPEKGEARSPTAVSKAPEPQPKQDPSPEKTPSGKGREKPGEKVAAAKSKEPEAAPVVSKKNKDAAGDPPAEDLSKIETSFKKHDHSKYTKKIRSSAVDQVNKDQACKFARLCRDTTTDEWGLTLYYLREKYYILAAYVWDEIDEQWKESFTSDKRPVSGWKHHLDFSSAGKECVILKGNRP